MKWKTFVCLVTTLVISSVCAAAVNLEHKNPNATNMLDHITYLYGPWDGHENYNQSTGNMVTESYSSPGTGDANGHCDVWVTGGGEGSGYFTQWKNYNCPVAGLDGAIQISYKYSATAELDCLLGGTAYAKIWLTFFVDDEADELVLYEKEVGINGHDEYNSGNAVETWSKSLTLTKKTYKIGVRASFELSMDMLVGTHSYCIAAIFGNFNPSDLIITITWPNQAPDKPEIISGENNGIKGHQYEYTAIGTDVEEDSLYYMFDWGDGTNMVWTPYVTESGKELKSAHVFSDEGTYLIKVKTKDTYGLESDWSEPYSVIMPRIKSTINPTLLQLIQRFTNHFQMMGRLLQNLI